MQKLFVRAAMFGLLIAQIQKVCDLLILCRPLSRRGRHDVSSLRICLHNLLYFSKVRRVRQGTPAEFGYFYRFFTHLFLLMQHRVKPRFLAQKIC